MTIFNLISFTLSFLSLFSCNEKNNNIKEVGQIELINEKTPIKYLALGDSYTICHNVNEKDRWPNQLGEKLRENKIKVENIDFIAQTGWTTNNLITALNTASPRDYNLVSLLIGVNNQFQKKSFSTFKSEFDQLITSAIRIAGSKKRLFVVSIPDYGVTQVGSGNSRAIGQEIDQYNNYMETECAHLDILFINITEISRALGNSNGALTNDNLHPSATQYTEWVNELLPEVLRILKK